MVKVRDEPEIEPQNGSRKFPLIQQPLPMNSNPLKACNNQNHLHQHRIYHHYTYYHHYSINQSETDVLSSGSGDSAAPKFYFGPGFEPQASGTGGCAVHDQARPGNDPKNQEYVVLFHVNPGVTISFQIGDTTEILRGPVTVPMVSTNATPPIAMPVTVPAGHVVQQIVDESGTLRHVILSPQHPAGLVNLPPHSQTFTAESNTTSNQRHYQNIPSHPNFAPHLHNQIPSPNLHTCVSNPQSQVHSTIGPNSPTPPPQTYCKDERAQRQHYKLKKKLYDKQIKGDPPTHGHNAGYLSQTKLLMCATANSAIDKKSMRKTGANSVETSEDGEESSVQDDEDSVRMITEILSSVEAPSVGVRIL